MCDESDDGHRRVGVGRQRGIEVSVPVEFYLLEPCFLEFPAEVFGQLELFGRAGRLAGVFGRLRVELRVVQESFYDIHDFMR